MVCKVTQITRQSPEDKNNKKFKRPQMVTRKVGGEEIIAVRGRAANIKD